MKVIKGFFLFASLAVLFASCDGDDEVDILGNWVNLSDFEGVTRGDAVSFSIGDYGYVGTGYDGTTRLKDFWRYDSQTNYWTQIAEFPGDARNAAVGFSAAGKGYVGTGYNNDRVRLNDFWEYDPTLDKWTRKADFAGTARYGAVAFSINNIGYIGSGYDGNYLKDFWAYDPASDTWEQKVSIVGSKRMDAVAFVINNKGYVVTGINNGAYVNDMLEYDPATGLWTEKRKISDVSDETYDDDYTIIRSNAASMVIGNKAYVTTGTSGSLKNDVWEYDVLTDTWDTKTSFEGTSRTDAVAFSITNNTKAYIATGRSGTSYFDDLWEFKPNDEYDKLD